jgi:cell division protein FtsI/penicillin-binding protein 2
MNDVPAKSRSVLNIILIAFSLIAIRVWYLSIWKHEEHKEIALRPKIKVVCETPQRGTIRDRFNIPLAVNKIQYNAAIIFDPIKSVPRVKIEKNEKGERKKTYPRKEYLSNFAKFLASNLELDATYVEDLIHSKLSLFPNTPFVLRENISENLYYQLRIQERDWPGLQMQIASRRYYPKGQVGANILGFLGSISEREFLSIQRELSGLETYLKDRSLGIMTVLPKGFHSAKEVKERYLELKNKTYTLQSKVGKAGAEGKFDQELRGISGKKKYEIDVKGNLLRELPESYEATPGRRFILSISSELQEFAEELLMESEVIRHERFIHAGKDHHKLFSPWIKGGAIVAMIPSTGEILALASFPRYNPNDFALKATSHMTLKWLESPNYIAQIWDGIKPLERELSKYNKKERHKESLNLSLDLYLNMILSTKSSVRKAIEEISNLQNAIYLQNTLETLFQLSNETQLSNLIDALFPPEKGHQLSIFKTSKEKREEILESLKNKTTLLSELFKELSTYLGNVKENDDKVLVIDLIRMICPSHLFDDALLSQTGKESLFAYREFNQAVMSVQSEIKKIARDVFHKNDFANWRKEYFTDYLTEKRALEKKEKTFQRPYLDYLTEMEEILFENFFQKYRFDFLAAFILDNAPLDQKDPLFIYYDALIHRSLQDKLPSCILLKNHLLTMSFEYVVPYLRTMRSFQELNRPLLGRYYFPAKAGKEALEKDLARHFYSSPGYGYARSFCYQETAPLGSIFKVVTGYEALRQHYLKCREKHSFSINPQIVVDQSPPYSEKINSSSVLGYTSAGIPITRSYKGGRLPRGHLNIGRIDLKGALERSSNLYFSLLASDVIENPADLIYTTKMFGFGKKTGVELPGEAKGIVPLDITSNQTALYSFSIGQHALTVTPLQTAVCLSSLANGGNLLKPQIVKTIANFEPNKKPDLILTKEEYLYKEYLNSVGIYFPLFTEAEKKPKEPFIWRSQPEIQGEVYLPNEIRSYLMEGLNDVVNGSRGTARSNVIRTLIENPILKKEYDEIKPYMIGKTSTAEILYRPFLNREENPVTCKHIWFGALGLKDKGDFESVDLCVVVLLRFADHGKEAAPLAAKVIKKWREIQRKHGEM